MMVPAYYPELGSHSGGAGSIACTDTQVFGTRSLKIETARITLCRSEPLQTTFPMIGKSCP